MAFRWTGKQSTRHDRRVLAFIVFLAGWVAGSPALAATIERIVVARDRIVIRFDRPVAQATSVLADTPRSIAVDVAGVDPGPVADGAGAVASVRQIPREDGTRILFRLNRPVVVTDGGFTDRGRELTLSLRQVDAGRYAAASVAGPLSFLPLEWVARRPAYKVSVPVPPPGRAAPLPVVAGDESRPLVVIDPGHGGFDPGAINPETGLREKDVTLKIAKAIRRALLDSGRVRVALTRGDDRYLVLRERYGIARRLHADLFISVHCDSVGTGAASGASVYTLSEVASDKEAARLAARENKADVIAGVNLADAGADVSSILIDLTQRETMNSSAGFARLLGREARDLVPMKPNFHRMASLMVLKAPDLPSILFETGYISNPVDAAFLDSADGRERIAEGVTRAVEVHFARRMASR